MPGIGIGVGTLFTPQFRHTLTAGLAAYYDLTSGPQDNSGHGKDGTPLNSPSYSASGAAVGFGNAIVLPANLLSSNVCSFSLWINPLVANFSAVAGSDLCAMFGYYDFGTDDGVAIGCNNGGGGGVMAGTFSHSPAQANGVLTAGVNTHVAVTSDGTNTRIFLNGSAVGSAGAVSFTKFNSQACVGAAIAAGGFNYQGSTVQSLGIYSRVLTPPEIKSLAARPLKYSDL